jgi:predicted transcriptional regulator
VSTAIREAPHHRNTVCVKLYGCQLPDCRTRFNERRRAIKAGTQQPDRILIDAADVREHIQALQELGMSLTGIARLAGVWHPTVCAFVHAQPSKRRGRRQQTTPETAAKILSVQPLTVIGALRRIQALAHLGWPVSHVARHAGISPRRAWELRPHSVISVGLAERLAVAYEELCGTAAEEHGVETWKTNRSRQRAKGNRWPDPKYWADRMDVIDDPDFEPMYGITRRQIIAQDASELIRYAGLDRAAAAERLGVSKSYVEHAFRDHPQYAVAVAA